VKKLILFLAFLLLASPGWAATYFLRADGTVTAANKANATSCSAAASAMNITQHNAATFAAGDTITLCDSGGVFRDGILTPPTTGTAGAGVITYNASGTPIISAADLVATWTEDPLAATVTDTFESGSVSAWWGSSGVAIENNAGTAHGGTKSALHNSSGDSLQKATGMDYSYMYLEYYMRISSSSSPSAGHQTRWMDIKLPHPYYVCGWLWYTSSQYRFGADTSLTVLPGTGQYAVLSTDTYYKIGLTINIAAKTYVLKVDDTTVSSGSIDASSTDIDAIIIGSNGWNETSFIVNTDDYSIYNVDPAGSSNVWKATLAGATPTLSVTYDRTLGTKVANKAAVTGTGKWFHDTAANLLYLYSTSDPDAAFVAPGVESSQRNQNMLLSNKSYLTIQDISFLHGNSSTEAAVQVTGGENGVFKNNVVKFAAYTGAFFGAASTGTQILNSEFAYNGNIGLDVDSSNNVTVDGGSAHHNLGAGGSGYYIGALTPTPTGSIIQNVSSYSNGGHGIVVDQSDSNTIQGNTIYSNTYNGIYIPANTESNIIRRNNIYSNGDTGVMVRDTGAGDVSAAIYYNIIRGHTKDGIRVYEGATASIYNNAIYGNTRSGIIAETAGTGVTIKNNILSTNTRYGIETDGNATITVATYNLYFGNILGTAVNFILGATDLTSDPLFVSTTNFHLQPTSPARRAGVNVGLTTDFAGRLVKDPPDIGAYQYSGGRHPMRIGGKWR
jgi:parallel beta-helix repeat protein